MAICFGSSHAASAEQAADFKCDLAQGLVNAVGGALGVCRQDGRRAGSLVRATRALVKRTSRSGADGPAVGDRLCHSLDGGNRRTSRPLQPCVYSGAGREGMPMRSESGSETSADPDAAPVPQRPERPASTLLLVGTGLSLALAVIALIGLSPAACSPRAHTS